MELNAIDRGSSGPSSVRVRSLRYVLTSESSNFHRIAMSLSHCTLAHSRVRQSLCGPLPSGISYTRAGGAPRAARRGVSRLLNVVVFEG